MIGITPPKMLSPILSIRVVIAYGLFQVRKSFLFNYVPFKMGILLKERFRSQRERIRSFQSSSFGMINYLYQTG